MLYKTCDLGSVRIHQCQILEVRIQFGFGKNERLIQVFGLCSYRRFGWNANLFSFNQCNINVFR